MPESAPVAPGEVADAAQYNALRRDILDTTVGHRHSGDPDDGRVLATPADDHLAYMGFAPDAGG